MVTLLIICLCLVITLCIVAQYICKYYTKKSKVQFSLERSINLIDLPIITMSIQGKLFNFLVDSGGDQSYINESDLKNLEYMSTQTKTHVVSAFTETECSTCELDLECDKHCFPVTFYIADFSEAFNRIREESGIIINGILGTSFLVKYKYVLDFAKLLMYSKK